MNNKHKFENSSSIVHIDHDGDSTMEIKFSSGATHHYYDCPMSVYEAMKKASSAGKFFHANVREKYKQTRIDN